MIYEHRHASLLPFRKYLRRVLRHVGLAFGIVVFSLALGAWGYHVFVGLGWLDATLNAAMILTGMGPVSPMQTAGGKLFAIFYALFSGVVFLTAVAILFAPIIHRFLHRFHLNQ